ncbi:glutathione S-transferase C-terminal domain-containing protein [Microcaecilia unicolor]|uniref:Glutathione S-transferase C-terminal domain-containing protein n=1 Tax=Microcaecilia unicolor TaxID=1415580 RepID=A0A6P7X4Z1_9AMPH|nr:glutathione S-transferase C-terminal domain-containing protein [Microcaecilia unicolor]
MKSHEEEAIPEHLYLELCSYSDDCVFPLHTTISLFLMTYCDCKIFKVFLVRTQEIPDCSIVAQRLRENFDAHVISRQELPLLVQNCCLPAILEKGSRFCRAGLAVVLRCIIQKVYEMDRCRKDLLELLGFKNTCLKACAEVSQWTKLCEISIPLAVESFLQDPTTIPLEILQLEKKMGEPVRVHNDDKIRRQKLQQQMKMDKRSAEATTENKGAQVETKESMSASLELRAALSKLTVEEVAKETNREPAYIRKTKTSDLPPLEHVFAEGLYFTLTDIVLLPCIHQFLVFVSKKCEESLVYLPLLSCWYRRIQAVPGVKKAAAKCGIQFIPLPDTLFSKDGKPVNSITVPEEKKDQMDSQFLGGPRPTMKKLMEKGIEARFSTHPCPSWTLDWKSLPTEVSPAKGKMSGDRALRKQQQLNNLVSVVMKLAKPGDMIVDFCSGGGHVGIVLAHILPSCQVVLIENKEESLLRAQERTSELGLNNIWFIQANLDYFKGKFNIGVALHSCGVATDMVIDHCIRGQASFIICPCCYGFIQNTTKSTFPRSHRFREAISYKEHMILCRFADQTAVQLPSERRLIGKHCMGLVDLDRAWAAEGLGYSTQVISMEPESCSPKNNMIVGVPL